MKKTLTKISLLAIFGLIGFNAEAQSYRTKTTYTEKHNGSEYKKTGDSSLFYFSGSQSWVATLGKDLSIAMLDQYNSKTTMGGDYQVPKYPHKYSTNIFTMDSSTSYSVNASGTAYGDEHNRIKITRDGNGNITEELTREYSGSSWNNNVRYTYSYNSANKITQVIKQTWTGGTWVNQTKEVSVYEGSKLTEFTTFTWTAGDWKGANKYLYEYSSAGDCTTMIYKSYSGSSWQNSSKSVSEYDGGHRITKVIYHSWTSSTWNETQKTLITYTTSGDVTNILIQMKSGSSWVDYQRLKVEYSSGLRSTYTVEQFADPIWEKVIKKSYTYTSANKVKTIVYQYWVTADSDWKNSRKLSVAYNSNNNISNFYDEVWNSGEYWEKNSTCFKYNFGYESYGSSSVNDLELQADVSVFPNPANTDLNVNINWKNPQSCNIAIYDINGRLMNTQDFAPQEQIKSNIHLQSFSTGNYFLKITSEAGQIVKQFQVVK